MGVFRLELHEKHAFRMITKIKYLCPVCYHRDDTSVESVGNNRSLQQLQLTTRLDCHLLVQKVILCTTV